MEYHVASLVAYCQASHRDAVRQAVSALPGAEVPEHQHEHHLVVVLEGESQAAILRHIDAIRALPGVHYTNLIYQQTDREPATREITQ